jgi:plasmid stability protein
MSLDLKPVQVRLPPDVYEALRMLADAHDHDLGEELREISTESIMGKAHSLRVTVERMARAVRTDNMRQHASTPANAAEALRERSEKELE